MPLTISSNVLYLFLSKTSESKAMIYRKCIGEVDNPGPLLAIMPRCHGAMIGVSATVRPTGAIYRVLDVVVAAIDAAVKLPVGRRDYSLADSGGATAANRPWIAANCAIEFGCVLDELDAIGRLL
jgi:hypothetical protein